MKKVVLSVALCLSMLVSSAQLGWGASAMTIRGFVRDAAGTAIANARVSDGLGKIDYTDSSGFYTIEEDFPQDYRITVSKTEIISQTRTVSLLDSLNDVNFEIRYVITTAISKPAVTTAGAAAETVFTVTSYAPYPGSCVLVTDSRTGSSSVADFVSSSSTTSTWQKTLTIPAQSAEGTFSLTAVAETCSSGLDLSIIPSPTQYVIDNTAPTVPLSGLMPVNGLQTMFANQPLSVNATDNLSGIQASGIAFTLRDLTSGTQTQALATRYVSGVGISADLPLTTGRTYNFQVSVADRAGNTTSLEQSSHGSEGWLVISVSPAAVPASIPRVDAATVTGDPVGGYKATFRDVQLVTQETLIQFSASRSDGTGRERLIVPLSTALVCNEGPLPDCQPVDLGSKTLTQDFSIPSSSSAMTAAVPAQTAALGDFTFKVPVTHTDPYLVMAPIQIVPELGTCKSPIAIGATPGCGTDPALQARTQRPAPIEAELVTAEPITYRADSLGITAEASINDVDANSVELRVSVLGLGSPLDLVTVATENGDGTISITTTNLATNEVRTETIQSTSGNCGKCDAAWGAAGGASAAACFWAGVVGTPAAGIACIAVAVAANAAANHYCDTDPCQSASPSCTGSSKVFDNRAYDSYWQMYSPSSASCSKKMEWITVKTRFYIDGQLRWDNRKIYCSGVSSCEDNWWYHEPELAGHCFQTVLEWEGRWRHPTTNEYRDYGSRVESDKLCF